MAEGTNVGNIFLDLIVRNTIGEQVNKIAQEGQATAKKAFSGMEKAAQSTVNNIAAQAGRAAQRTAEAASQGVQKTATSIENVADKLTASLGGKFVKPVEVAKARFKSLSREFEELAIAYEEKLRNDSDFQVFGETMDRDGSFAKMEKQLDRLYQKAEEARERLAIEVQAAVQKQADAEERASRRTEAAAKKAAEKAAAAAEKAALKQQMAAQKAAEKAAAAAQKSAEKRKQAEQKAAAEAERAAQRAVAAAEKAASRRKAIHAKMWKNMLAKAGDAAKKITSRILGIDRSLDKASRSARRFSSRLRRIVSGALLFNGISRLLHNLTSYLGNAISSADQMKQALANLKGAAATAAAPIIQALTPALAKLANMAATVFSYVSKLISFFTGKSVSSMSAAAKKMNTSATNAANKASAVGKAVKKAAASLASFDEIEKASSTDDTSDSGSIDGEEYLPNYDFNGRSPFLDDLLEAIKAGQWEQVGGLIAEKINESLARIPWDNIQNKVRSGMEALADVINGFVDKLNWPLLGHSIAEGLNTITTGIDAFFQRVNWQQLGTSLGAGLNQLFTDLDWETLGRVLTDRFRAVFETLHGFVAEFDPTILAGNLVKMISAAINNVNWPQLVTDLCTGASKLLDGLILFFQEFDWGSLGRTLGQCVENIRWAEVFSKLGTLLWEAFKAALEVLVEFIKSLGPETIWGGIMAVIAAVAAKIAGQTLITPLITAFGAMLKTVAAGIVSAIGGWPALLIAAVMAVFAALALAVKDGGVEVVQGFFLGIQEKLVNIGQWLNEHIFQPFVEAFKSLFGIHSPSTVMEEFGIFLIEGLLNGIKNTWNAITEFFSGALERIRAVVTGSLGATEETSANAWNSMESDATNAGSSIDAAAQSAWGSVSQSAVTNLTAANATVSEQLLLMQENAALALDQLQLRFDQSMAKLRDSLSLTWKDTAANINRQITDMKTTVLKSVESLRQEMDTVWTGICEDTDSVIGRMSDSTKTGIDRMCDAAVEAFRNMHSQIRQEWDHLDVYLNTMLNAVNRTFREQWNSLQTLTENAWRQITDSVSSLAEEMERQVTDSVTAMYEKLHAQWPQMTNDAISNFQNMLNGIITICSSIISVVQGMCNSVSTMCSNAISMINQVNRAAGGISYSSYSGTRTYSVSSSGSRSSGSSAKGVTGYGGSVSYVTGADYTGGAGGSSMHLATGGITTGPTEALIGEAGREAVLPLERNLGYLEPLAQKLTQMIRNSLTVQPVLTMIPTGATSGSASGAAAAFGGQESDLAGMLREIADRNQENLEQVVEVLRDILEAVLGIEIGDEMIAGAVTRYQNKMAIVKGVHE